MVWTTAQRAFEETLLGQVHTGLAKYGTTLRTFNGRDSYIDFLQEQADGLMYATQLYLEARTFVQLLVRSMDTLDDAAYWLEQTSLDAPKSTVHQIDTLRREIGQCLKKSGLSRSVQQSHDGSS